MNRDKVLQIRFNPDELEAIARLAKAEHLPIFTFVRQQLLKAPQMTGKLQC